MRINISAFLFIMILSLFLSDMAYADSAVFSKLKTTAGEIGSGLKQVGYAAAGLGLIALTFGAIFGKVNWKTLGYIMLSCFILTMMTAVIGKMKGNEDYRQAHQEFQSGRSRGNASVPGNTDQVTIRR